jgi:hypothetical protein
MSDSFSRLPCEPHSRTSAGIDIAVTMDCGGVVVGDKVSISLEIQAVLQK